MYFPSGAHLPFLGGGYGGEICNGVPEVTKTARKVLRQGFDFIKVATSGGFGFPSSKPEHTEWTLDELKAIVHEASARGKGVMAHAINNQGIRNALEAGVWSIEHGTCLDDETILPHVRLREACLTLLRAFDSRARRPRHLDGIPLRAKCHPLGRCEK